MNHFLKVRREAIIAGILWVVFATWTITACYIIGYKAQSVTFIFGIPNWIVWGVLLPWVCATIANSVFALLILADDE